MKKSMSSKKWCLSVLISFVALLLAVAISVIIIDPFLHYHAPTSGLSYPLKDERYINDGLSRHYSYEGIITGSSTSQNFKASQYEELFSVNTIKLTYPSATYYEVAEGLKRAFSRNSNVKSVLWGLDLTRINSGSHDESYEGLPKYLYDNNPFNDVSYLFNLDVLKKCINVINYTRSGQTTTSMDDYGAWYPWATYGREKVLNDLIDYSDYSEEYVLSDTDIAQITENVTENILNLAQANPDVTFNIFFTPSSSVFWYGMLRTKQLNAQIDAEKLAASLLVNQKNIRLYGFADRIDITANLDNYMDSLHYSPEISDKIIEMVKTSEGLLTPDNYDDYYESLREIYSNYEFDYEK